MGTSSILELEKQKSLLTENLSSCTSVKQKVFLISQFFDELLGIDASIIKESYISEFINDYLNCLTQYDSFCIHPKYSQQIIQQLKTLEEIESLKNYHERIQQLKNSIQLCKRNRVNNCSKRK